MHNMVRLRQDFGDELLERINLTGKSVHAFCRTFLTGSEYWTVLRLTSKKADRRSKPLNIPLGTFIKLLEATGTTPEHWILIGQRKPPEWWRAICATHGDLEPEEIGLLNEVIYISRNGNSDQKYGMTSHIIKLCQYIQQTKPKKAARKRKPSRRPR